MLSTDPRTLARAGRRMFDIRALALAPRERLTLSQWADRYAKLSVETSSEPGDWLTFGPQREPMDCMTDPRYRRVVMRKGVRIGFTKALLWLSAYHIHWDPAPILFFQPTDDAAKDFDESEILPMIRDVEEVRQLSNVVLDGKAKEQWHTRKFKNGAILRLRGAKAEGNFRRLTTRINIGDEIDDTNWDDKSGDKLARLKKRGTTFWNSKLILGGSPVLPAEHGGRTDAEFLDSDQRYYHIKCPCCGHEQPMVWGEKDGPGIHWDEGLTRAWYRCEKDCEIEERHRIRMLEGGRWIARNPTHPDPGFHYPQYLSQFVGWLEMAQEWKRALAGGAKKVQVFKNEVLGEPFQPEFSPTSEVDDLLSYVTDYGAEIPDWAEALTMGVDVQRGDTTGTASYMEAGLWAWGRNGRSALVAHWVLDDFPLTDPKGRAFDELEALATRTWTSASGRVFRVEALCIDSHGGFTQKVYDWIGRMRRKGRRFWFAVRGHNGAAGTRQKTIWPAQSAKKRPILFTIDVSLAKDEINERLIGGLVEFPAQTLPGGEVINEAFFKRLTREKPLPVPGQAAPRWTTPSDQEPWDCFVYAFAATHALMSLGGTRWRRAFGTDVVVRPTAAMARVEDVEDVEEAEVVEMTPAGPEPERDPGRIFVPRNPNTSGAPKPPSPPGSRPPGTGLIRVRR
ncbi:terminase gpA endonuclease subunit [Paracoccus sp. SSK6]|uniref:terminase gpA endonuclease subunit n=1 Tax=Paracoccus sp. SSK6 TaxID=3143131 RepID=UPI003218EA5D